MAKTPARFFQGRRCAKSVNDVVGHTRLDTGCVTDVQILYIFSTLRRRRRSQVTDCDRKKQSASRHMHAAGTYHLHYDRHERRHGLHQVR